MAPPQTPRIAKTDPVPAGVKPTYNPSIINLTNLKFHRRTYPRMKPIDLVASILHKVDPKLSHRFFKGDGYPDAELVLKLKGSENKFWREDSELSVSRKQKATGMTVEIVFIWEVKHGKGTWGHPGVWIMPGKDNTKNDDVFLDGKEAVAAAKQALHAMVDEKVWMDAHCVNYHYRFGAGAGDDASTCRAESDSEDELGEEPKDEEPTLIKTTVNHPIKAMFAREVVERTVPGVPPVPPRPELVPPTLMNEDDAQSEYAEEGEGDDGYYVSGEESDGVLISSPSESEA